LILKELAEKLNAHLEGDGSLKVGSIAPLKEAKAGDLTFVLEKKFIKHAQKSPASAFITGEKIPNLVNQVIVKNPKSALADVISLLFPNFQPYFIQAGISPKADIHPSAKIAKDVAIGPFAVIGEGASIGEGTQIAAHVVIGKNVSIGARCRLYPQVTVYNDVTIGDAVHIHAGTAVGSEGFGYYLHNDQWHHINQVGGVTIGNEVEIGANTCIDRGCLDHTKIENGVKIDNLVQIAHNAYIGEHCLIAGQSGVLGSAHLEHHVVLAGQSGVGHVRVGAGTQIAARAAVSNDTEPQSILSGNPAWPHMEELKKEAFIRKLYKQSRLKKAP
jgi:UDP-3-O-[3-hydroxymyristoyl] glucosamine N-acyltransferase